MTTVEARRPRHYIGESLRLNIEKLMTRGPCQVKQRTAWGLNLVTMTSKRFEPLVLPQEAIEVAAQGKVIGKDPKFRVYRDQEIIKSYFIKRREVTLSDYFYCGLTNASNGVESRPLYEYGANLLEPCLPEDDLLPHILTLILRTCLEDGAAL